MSKFDPTAVAPFNDVAVKNLREVIRRQMEEIEKEKDSVFEKNKPTGSPEEQKKNRNYMRALAIVYTNLEQARHYLGECLPFHGVVDVNAKEEKERVDQLQRT